jgi:hypothetical protein
MSSMIISEFAVESSSGDGKLKGTGRLGNHYQDIQKKDKIFLDIK